MGIRNCLKTKKSSRWLPGSSIETMDLFRLPPSPPPPPQNDTMRRPLQSMCHYIASGGGGVANNIQTSRTKLGEGAQTERIRNQRNSILYTSLKDYPLFCVTKGDVIKKKILISQTFRCNVGKHFNAAMLQTFRRKEHQKIRSHSVLTWSNRTTSRNVKFFQLQTGFQNTSSV